MVSLGLATFATAAQMQEVIATDVVSEHWRGAFDLLVRPSAVVSPLETQEGLVEGNYLGTPSGGISHDQYQSVKGLPGVEVAAPVATVGFMLNRTGGVDLEIDPAVPGTLYRAEIALAESDTHGRALRLQQGYFGIPPAGQMEGLIFSYGDIRGGFTDPSNRLSVSLGDLPVLWTLLSGIDPDEEAKLTGINEAINGIYLPAEALLRQTFDPAFGGREATQIPIIVSKRAFLDLVLTARVEALPLANDPVWGQLLEPHSQETLKKTMEVMASQLSQKILEQTVGLDGLVSPLGAQTVTLAPGHPPESRDQGASSLVFSNVLLYPGPFQYEIGAPPEGVIGQLALTIVEEGHWDDVIEPLLQARLPEGWQAPAIDVPDDAIVYRPMTAYEPPAFVFDVMGIYDLDGLTAPSDPLSYVPLGIYEPPLAVLRYDQGGNPVEPRVLTPNLNPAAFIPRPPLALTTLEAAEFLRGRADYIDAIRVRVAGIQEYTEESMARVEQVASEITERTGLHVDIVASSSPQKVLVFVPGLGYVEERWTTLGVATEVISGINAANLVLLGTLLATSVLFIANAAQLSVLRRRREIGLLQSVGWRAADINWFLLSDAVVVGILAAPLAALTATILLEAADLRLNWATIAAVSLAAPLLYCVSSWLPIQHEAAKAPITLLHHGEVAGGSSFHRFAGRPGVFGVAVQQLWRKPLRMLLMVLVVGLGVALAIVVINVLVQVQGRLKVTLLGEQVALGVRTYHHLMVVAALAMGMLTMLEGLLASVLERSQEFGLLSAIGWRFHHLAALVMWEGVVISVLGGLLGALVGSILFLAISGGLPPVWSIAVLGVILSMILGALTSVYPALQAVRLPPSEVLTGPERQTYRGPMWHKGVALAIAVAFLGIMVLVGDGRHGIERALDYSAAPVPAHRSDKAAAGERALKHARQLAALGPRTWGNEAQARAAEYIAQSLSDLGLQVSREPVVLAAIAFSGPDGPPILQLPGPAGQVRALAVHSQDLRGWQPITGAITLIPSGATWPQSKEVEGKILIFELGDFSQDPVLALQSVLAHYGQPAPYLAVVIVLPDEDMPLDSILQPADIMASIPVAENIIGTLPGQVQSDREIWLVAHYDSGPDSPGADQGASGIGALLELARMLSDSDQPVTTRLLALVGGEASREGAAYYVLGHQMASATPLAVLEIDQLGNWDRLVVGTDLEAPTWNGEPLDREEQAQIRQEGQSFLTPTLLQSVDLDNTNPSVWIERERAKGGGLSESPSALVDQALDVADSLGIIAEARAYPCSRGYLIFLMREYPAMAVCGEGNGLAGSRYDTADTLRPEAMDRALALVIQVLNELVVN